MRESRFPSQPIGSNRRCDSRPQRAPESQHGDTSDAREAKVITARVANKTVRFQLLNLEVSLQLPHLSPQATGIHSPTLYYREVTTISEIKIPSNTLT